MLAVLLTGIMTGAAAKKALRTRLVIVKPSAIEFPLGPFLRALICEPTAHGPFMVSADPLERPSGSSASWESGRTFQHARAGETSGNLESHEA
jgi:hypothetical protein